MKKNKQRLINVFLLVIVGTSVFAYGYDNPVEDYIKQQTMETAEYIKYVNLFTNAFSSSIANKYPNAKQSQTECEKLIKEYMQINNLKNSVNNTFRDSTIKTYCTPQNIEKIFEAHEDLKGGYTKVPERVGYHDSDDKSGFWIPSNINPIMKSNTELENYRLVNMSKLDNYINSMDYYNLSRMHYCTESEFKDKTILFIQNQINTAKAQNRPLIVKDVKDAIADVPIYFELRFDLKDVGPMEYISSKPNGLGHLSSEGERKLKMLTDKYGESIFDDVFKQRLNLYRERQKIIKQQQRQEEVTNFVKTLFGI